MTIEEAIKASKTGIGFLGNGHIKLANKMLSASEEVLYAIIANISIIPVHGKLDVNTFQIKNKLTGVVAITNTRVLFASNMLGNTTSKAIHLSNITSIDDKGTLFGASTIRIQGISEMFVIDSNKVIMNHLKSALETAISQMNTHTNEEPVQKSVSAADEVLKLKQLLDIGVLTQEEFEKKKKEILGL